MDDLYSAKLIRELLRTVKTIAIVGLSPKETRPSYLVGKYLINKGYDVIPVNPGQECILGLKCFPDLESIPQSIDLVNVFRRSDDVLPVVGQAIKKNVKGIWMQLGIENKDAAKLALENNITVIMNRCIKIDHQDLF